MLEIDNLFFYYSKARVLDGISFGLETGKLYGLFGPNGAGKTTLFRLCLGILQPHSGNIFYKSVDVMSLKAPALARIFSWVPQEHSPPFPFTVRELVLMGMAGSFGYGPKAEHQEKAIAAMERLGISELAERPYTKLSGGQRQLALIARALAQDTPLLFFDEPGASLDYKNQIMLWQILKSLSRKGKTILACAHDPNHLLWYCDEAIVLEEGRLAAKGAVNMALNQGILDRLYGKSFRLGKAGACQVVYPASDPGSL